MSADDINFFTYCYIFVAVIVSVFVAFKLEKRLKERTPATRPYRWGFYVGCMGIACAPIILLMALAGLGGIITKQPGVATECIGYALYCAIQAVCGWFIIKRKRWAWVVGTAASFNIVWWIANSIYAKNRWQEFVGVPYTPPPEETAYELLNAATKLETQGRVQEAIAAYQHIADTYPNTAGGQDALKSIESLRIKRG
jgi:hypothetical protein